MKKGFDLIIFGAIGLVIIFMVYFSFISTTGNVTEGPPENAGEVHSIGPSQEEQDCMKNCGASFGCSEANMTTCIPLYSETCMTQCNAQKPEATEETSCMEECVTKGCGEFDFSCQTKNQNICEAECNMIKEPEAKNKEEQCIRDCVNAESPGTICQAAEGGEQGNELCQKCAEQCEYLYEGPCLDELKLEAAKSVCNTCEHCYGEPIMGDSGEGYQCIVGIECKDASSEFGDNPGIGEGIAKAVGNAIDGIKEFFSNLFSGEQGEESQSSTEPPTQSDEVDNSQSTSISE